MQQYCYHCTAPIESPETFCPHCGFDLPSYSVKLHHLIPGTLLSGRYSIGKVLGEGGFGITYVALDTRLRRKVAIKEFYMSGFVSRFNTYSSEVQLAGDSYTEAFEKNRTRFLDETQVLAQFAEEEGIVGIHDFFTENNTAYIVMSFLDGETLKAHLAKKGTLTWPETRQILMPVLRSLSEVHRHSIIHRDISPDNIMITTRGQVKLLDFGAAREFSQIDARSLSVILKPGYAPMEQYQTKGKQGPWTDVYALCATIYRCLTGTIPEDAMERVFDDQTKDLGQLCSCPAAISQAVMKGLAVRPQDRLQSVDELLTAIEAAEMPPPIPAPVYTDPDATVYAGPSAAAPPAPVPPQPVTPQFTSASSHHPVPPVVPVSVPHPSDPVIPAPINAAPSVIGTKALAIGAALNGQCSVGDWKHITSMSGGGAHTLGLTRSGSVCAAGLNRYGQCNTAEWSDIVAISAGRDHSVGVRRDGAVLAVGFNNNGQCDTSLWSGILSVSAGLSHTLGLKTDGTVMACGWNHHGQCDVSGWRNIVSVSAGSSHSVGLTSGGTVVFTGHTPEMEEMTTWNHIVTVCASNNFTIALREDGTVLSNQFRSDALATWKDIIAIATGFNHVLGLTSAGTVLATGWGGSGECKVGHWKNIVSISAGHYHSLGLCTE